MGRAGKFNASSSLTEEQKLGTIDLQRKLAKQNVDLLHGSQLQHLRSLLATPRNHSGKARDHLASFRPNSADDVLEGVGKAVSALARIHKPVLLELPDARNR